MVALLLKIWKVLPFSTKLQLFFARRLNDQFLVGVTGVFLNDKNQVLLVKHTYRDTSKWSLPGGYIKAGEHPREGLEREVKEETGFVVSADENVKLRTDRESARFDITYKGRFIGGVFEPSKEVAEAKFFSFAKLPSLPSDQLMFIAKVLEK